MKKISLIAFLIISFLAGIAQTAHQAEIRIDKRFTLANRSVKGISNDPVQSLSGSPDSLVTTFGFVNFVKNNLGWGFSGNTVLNGSRFIGTSNLASLRFRTNNVERMVLDSLGRLSLSGTAASGQFIMGDPANPVFAVSFPSNILSTFTLKPNSTGYTADGSGSGFGPLEISSGPRDGIKSRGIYKGMDFETFAGFNFNTPFGTPLYQFNLHKGATPTIYVRANNTVHFGDTADVNSAMFTMQWTGTPKGVLLPRMTTAQMNAIVSPAIGLVAINTDTPSIFMYNGGVWKNMLSAGGGGGGGGSDGNNFSSGITFPGRVLTIARTGLANITYDLGADLDSRYLQSYSETDPNVASLIKSIPVSADATANKYLNWNGSAYIRKQMVVADISGLGTLATQSGTFSGNSSGTNTGDQTSVTGNAGTVTNGIYSTGSYSNPSWLTGLSWSKITGAPTYTFDNSNATGDTLALLTASRLQLKTIQVVLPLVKKPSADSSLSYGIDKTAIDTVGTVTEGTWQGDAISNSLEVAKLLGGSLVAEGLINASQLSLNTTFNTGVRITIIHVKQRQVLTGVNFLLTTSGVYNQSNFNGFALYTSNIVTGIGALIATTNNDSMIWKPGSSGWQKKAYITPYTANPGVYYLLSSYGSAGTPTQNPIVASGPNLIIASAGSSDYPSNGKTQASGTAISGTTAPATLVMSSYTQTTANYYFGNYQ